MRRYIKLFLLSLSATVILVVPFLIYYRLSLADLLGIACLVAASGPLAAWSYTMRAPKVSEEWQFHFALFPATFALIMQAILVSGAHYSDSGTIIPISRKHVIIVAAGFAAFGISMWLPSRLVRLKKTPNQSLHLTAPSRRG